jgi:CO/xanthine dehydrogenase FAD-binding subunit
LLVVQRHVGRVSSRFSAPETLDEAVALLAGDDGSRPVGGNTYLMWRAAHGEPMPAHLVSLHRVPGLDALVEGSIGAGTSLRVLERSEPVGAQRALTMAASVVAGPPVRSLATIGGNVASRFSHADLLPALLALEADVVLHGEGKVDVQAFISRPSDQSMILGFEHAGRAAEGWTGATVKLARRGMDLSIVTVSVSLRIDGGVMTGARVAAGSLADAPQRLRAVEEALLGAEARPTVIGTASAEATNGIRLREDLEAPSTYRARVAAPIVRRAIGLAIGLGPFGRPGPGMARV